MPFDPLQHIDAFVDEATRCRELGATLDHRVRLPHLPRWTVGSVLAHLVADFEWATAIVAARSWDGSGFGTVRLRGPSLLDRYDRAVASMIDALHGAAREPDAPCPNFADRAGGLLDWWPRHQAHETAMHRWDLESADGAHQPFVPQRAADGVDEALHVYAARYRPHRIRGPVALHATDTGDRWLARPTGGGGIELSTDADAAALVAVSAPASELLLLVWKRRSWASSTATVRGEAAEAARWFAGPLTA